MNSGFSLIEILIYILILVSILIFASAFFWQITSLSIREDSFQEVQQNSRFAIIKIGQEIKKARSIIFPLPGSTSSSLSLEMAETSSNPTIFDLENGKLRITKGSNPSIFLTTDRVKVSNLIFQNLSYPNTPGTVRIEMAIEHSNPANRIEYQASINLKSSFSLFEASP